MVSVDERKRLVNRISAARTEEDVERLTEQVLALDPDDPDRADLAEMLAMHRQAIRTGDLA